MIGKLLLLMVLLPQNSWAKDTAPCIHPKIQSFIRQAGKWAGTATYLSSKGTVTRKFNIETEIKLITNKGVCKYHQKTTFIMPGNVKKFKELHGQFNDKYQLVITSGQMLGYGWQSGDHSLMYLNPTSDPKVNILETSQLLTPNVRVRTHQQAKNGKLIGMTIFNETKSQ